MRRARRDRNIIFAMGNDDGFCGIFTPRSSSSILMCFVGLDIDADQGEEPKRWIRRMSAPMLRRIEILNDVRIS